MNRFLRSLLHAVGIKSRDAGAPLPVLGVGAPRRRKSRPAPGRPGTGGFRRACLRARARGRHL